MPRKKLITLPEGVNPGALLTFKKVEELFGVEETTLRSWRCQPGIGLRFIKIKGRIYVKCDEFIAWVNLVAVEVVERRFTFSSESVSRGNGLPRRLHA